MREFATAVNRMIAGEYIDTEWEGKAKDNFKMNLRLDAVKVAAQYEALYGVLVGEINMLMVSMNSKDKTLIENDFSL